MSFRCGPQRAFANYGFARRRQCAKLARDRPAYPGARHTGAAAGPLVKSRVGAYRLSISALSRLWPGKKMPTRSSKGPATRPVAPLAAVLLLMLAAAGARGQAPADNAAVEREGQAAHACKSVVLRHCHGAVASVDDTQGAAAFDQSRWAAEGDDDEIIVTAQRLARVHVREVFERNLAAGLGQTGYMQTRDVGAGVRCSGPKGIWTCSRSGNTIPAGPGTDTSRADWTF